MAEIIKPKPFSHLEAISSIDGRFRGRVEGMSEYFSEFATIRGRVQVEIEYLISLTSLLDLPLNKTGERKLQNIYKHFSLTDAEAVWDKDLEINHDTKAVEIFLSGKLRDLKLDHLINYLHFGLTSTDVDNTAFAISLGNFRRDVYMPAAVKLIETVEEIARDNRDTVMLARTHGQVAVPTTAGKELSYFAQRLTDQASKFQKIKLGSKMTGAVGNFNALHAAYPKIDWPGFIDKFLDRFGLESYGLTTQVEPYDHKVELIQAAKRLNLVVKALDEDIWRYLALGYLSMHDEKGHVGSSTMPQKINPIGFEMSENYTSLANAIFSLAEERLPLNRWQRDITDKYLLREVGTAFTASVLAYESTTDALKHLGFNKGVIDAELENHWESIAEGVQTILRTTNYTEPYEKLKELTRGKTVTKETYEQFIEEIDVPEEIKARLRKLSPQTYIGLAKRLTF